MDNYSYLTNATPEYLENLYLDFKANPESVDKEFRKFFEGFDFAVNGNYAAGQAAPGAVDVGSIDWMQEIKVYRLILGYRNKGHLIAKTNPILIIQ